MGSRVPRRWLKYVLLLLELLSVTACQNAPGQSQVDQLNPTRSGQPGVVWQPIAGNPQLVGGKCFSWRCAGMGDPAIKRLADGSLLLLFTTMGVFPNSNGGFRAEGPWIGRATGFRSATDKLIIAPETPVIAVGTPGQWDRYVETPALQFDPKLNRWRLWYMGFAAKGGKTGFVQPAIGQTTSIDTAGEHWTRSPKPIYRPSPQGWDNLLVTGPTVFRQGKEWRLYYSGWGINGTKATQGIGLLTSKDGIHWQAYAKNPVLPGLPGQWDEQILEPAVIYHRGQYWLWYSGMQGQLNPQTRIAIGLATCKDGIHWKRYGQNPVLSPGLAGSWNDQRVLAPDVMVQRDGSLLMAAYGQSQEDVKEQKSSGSIGLWISQ